ncbi:hypothetical protein LCGC14_0801320 [marine sediment metagenome]|uniref:TIR domain-containing protein n=1 Tax=marine sediment metagenome TaxID=412755 RepID=A0A0F9S9H9_9ZZZZ
MSHVVEQVEAAARSTIFISHATPEDDEFVIWLGSRLVAQGYRVWAEVLNLRGGEMFWRKIEDVIRNEAVNVLAVISKASLDLGKTGAAAEQSVADTVAKKLGRTSDFIIPLRIDETDYGEFPIAIHQRHAIDFSRGWGRGLRDLIDELAEAGTPKVVSDVSSAFDAWRTTVRMGDEAIEANPEPLLSNMLRVAHLPATIKAYEFEGSQRNLPGALAGIPEPTRLLHRLVFSFADADVLQDGLGDSFGIRLRKILPLTDFLTASDPSVTLPRRREARSFVTELVRRSFELHLTRHGLAPYATGRGQVLYFKDGVIEGNKVRYVNAKGKRTHKLVVGRSDKLKLNWHFGISVQFSLEDESYIKLRPYVVFTDDHWKPIAPDEMTKARRRFCKSWWNGNWRQLFEAFYAFLSENGEDLTIPLGVDSDLQVAGRGFQFESPMRILGDIDITEEEPVEPLDDAFEDDLDEEDVL